MEMVRIVNTHLTVTYESESIGIQTISWPVLLVPPCPVCGRPVFAFGNDLKQNAICKSCVHAKTNDCKKYGTPNTSTSSQRTGTNGLRQQGSQGGFNNFEATEQQRNEDAKQNCEIHGSQQANTWNVFNELWMSCGRFCTWARLKNDLWVGMTRVTALISKQTIRNQTNKSFGENAYDFTLLAAEIAWHFPGGIAVMNLDKKICLVCKPGQQAQIARLKSAISWLRLTRSQSLGIAFKIINEEIQGAIVDVQYNPRNNENESMTTHSILLAAVASVITSGASKCS